MRDETTDSLRRHDDDKTGLDRARLKPLFFKGKPNDADTAERLRLPRTT